MGRGIVSVLRKNRNVELVAIGDINPGALQKIKPILPNGVMITTKSAEVLTKKPDILIEATPSIFEAAQLVINAIEQKTHVILMNSEVDQTFGLLLAKKAQKSGVILTSDAGDQHGVLARTIEDTREMGFEVVMAGNNKSYLDHYANPDSIKEEAAKRRLSLDQCTAYTDGTKLAIEMALVANAFQLDLLQTGMTGPRVAKVEEALEVFDLQHSRKLGGVVDYILGARPGGSVFVIGYSDDPEDRFYMNYYKMGEGPFYLFMRPYHVCHFETPLAIRRIIEDGKPILVQKRKILDVGCRAKTDLPQGMRLEGIGGHHVYGVVEKKGNLPIGLVRGTTLINPKEKNDAISWDDVEFPRGDPRLALWHEQTRLEA